MGTIFFHHSCPKKTKTKSRTKTETFRALCRTGWYGWDWLSLVIGLLRVPSLLIKDHLPYVSATPTNFFKNFRGCWMANFTGGAQWADTAVLLISSPNKALLLFASGPALLPHLWLEIAPWGGRGGQEDRLKCNQLRKTSHSITFSLSHSPSLSLS